MDNRILTDVLKFMKSGNLIQLKETEGKIIKSLELVKRISSFGLKNLYFKKKLFQDRFAISYMPASISDQYGRHYIAIRWDIFIELDVYSLFI